MEKVQVWNYDKSDTDDNIGDILYCDIVGYT